jgi:RNA polymerase sigma factor (sigma-70 family)
LVGGSTLVSDRGIAGPSPDTARIYREERGAVLWHLVRLTGDRQLAEDLTQEAFGRLMDAGTDTLRNPRAWLTAVASNLAFNHFRSESRRVERERTHGLVESVTTPDRDEVLDVRSALAELDPRDAAMLLMRHSGFSYADIADAVGIAPGSVGTILARAQGRFREVYEGRATVTGAGAPYTEARM